MIVDGFSTLFFDLDGTLTDPAEGITNSFIHALKSFDREIPSYEKLCSFIGPPLAVSFGELLGFPESDIPECIKRYREYFSTKGLFENRVYEGIPELLEQLVKSGKKLYVATSKPELYSVKILEHFNLAGYFEKICGSLIDESRSKKAEVIAYALECSGVPKSEVLMIGDRKFDIEGAKENGIKSCGVLYGYGSRQEFETYGADYIAESVYDLKSSEA